MVFENLRNRFSYIRHYLKNKDFMPFSLDSRLFPNEQYSDFFLFCNQAYSNKFIAENSYALLMKKKIRVMHRFDFFDKNGKNFDSFQFIDSNLYSKIKLPKFVSNDNKYLSFTHKTILLNKDEYSLSLKKKISLQHRGYSIIQKFPNSLGSVVHGNFGGIDVSQKIVSKAKTRKCKYIYTPVYNFKKKLKYDLFFNNPTSGDLKIKILKHHPFSKNKFLTSINIPPFGNNFCQIDNYKGIISFESYLPVCRALVITDPEGDSNNFDVFHS